MKMTINRTMLLNSLLEKRTQLVQDAAAEHKNNVEAFKVWRANAVTTLNKALTKVSTAKESKDLDGYFTYDRDLKLGDYPETANVIEDKKSVKEIDLAIKKLRLSTDQTLILNDSDREYLSLL